MINIKLLLIKSLLLKCLIVKIYDYEKYLEFYNEIYTPFEEEM